MQYRENGPARHGADRAGGRAAADHAQDAHAARRPRRAAARQASRVPLADLGITKTHSRPYTSSDNPYSESNFKTLKYRPEFPARFDDIEHARAHCRAFVDWYNHAHRHSGIGLMTPAAVHHGQAHAAARRPRPRARRRLRAPPRAVRPQAARPARAADRRMDQQARHEGGRSLNPNAKRLIGLDRLRCPYLDGREYLLSRRPIDAPTSGLVFPTTTGNAIVARRRSSGAGALLSFGECDSAPGLLGGPFRASTITCRVAKGRTGTAATSITRLTLGQA